MDKDEIKNRISLALKNPILQQGFECICKEIVDLKAYNEKLLNGDIEKHNKIVELEKELAKRAEQIEALNKDKDYFSDALDKQIEATYKVVEELNEAKEILREFVGWADWQGNDCPSFESIKVKTEKFLKEE